MNDYQNHPLAGADDLDSAMSKLWVFYKKYFVGMYVISVLMALLSGVITSRFDMSSLYSGYTGDPEQLLEMMKGMVVPYSLLLIVTFVFGVLLHAWILERPLGRENTIIKSAEKQSGCSDSFSSCLYSDRYRWRHADVDRACFTCIARSVRRIVYFNCCHLFASGDPYRDP